jgi:hypothetical protein
MSTHEFTGAYPPSAPPSRYAPLLDIVSIALGLLALVLMLATSMPTSTSGHPDIAKWFSHAD